MEDEIKTKEELEVTETTEEVKKEPVEVKQSIKVTTKDLFMEALDAASSIMGEAKMQFASGGMRLAGIDPASVCMVDLRLSSDNFESYEVTGDPEISVNITNLKKIVKDCGSKGVTLELMDGYLKVYKTRKRFTVPLLAESENKLDKVPTLSYSSEFIPNKTIKEDVKILSGIGESILFKLKPEGLSLITKGDLNSGVFDIEGTAKSEDIQEAKFSEEYLTKIFGWKGEIKKVEVKSDYPLRVTYEFGIAILAPRISND